MTTTVNTAARNPRALNAALWTAQGLLFAAFAMTGASKLALPIAQLAQQMPWTADVPALMVRGIGLAELAGALGLILPGLFRTRTTLTPLAALGLVALMLLASVFHVTRGETAMVPANLVLAAVAAFVAQGRARLAPLPARR
ncbi:MAG TPA: DoxX family protein [Deinococcales bacterium]|nr:DoxX family protein [Deinococcales bacterium]